MNDIAKFYSLLKTADENETKIKESKIALETVYAELVKICPHSEAIDWDYSNGVYRVCMICGVTDYASEGGTSGDEYNYGTNGYPNRTFWNSATIIKASSEKEHWKYRNREHDYIVKSGKVVKRFG